MADNDNPRYSTIILIAALAGSGSGLVPGVLTQEKVENLIHDHSKIYISELNNEMKKISEEANSCKTSLNEIKYQAESQEKRLEMCMYYMREKK